MLDTVSHAIEVQNAGGTPLRRQISDPVERMLKSNIQTAKQGHFLLMEGDQTDSVFCLLSGWLSLSKYLPDGEVQIMDFALPGEIIDLGGAGGSVSSVNIEALTDVSFAMIPVSIWEDTKRKRPDLSRIARSIRAAAQARTAGRMLRLGRGRAVMRMAYALLELHIRLEAIGSSKDGEFHIPMNQRILGDFVGLSSVHVCRTLGQLVGDGVVRIGGQMNIEILALEQLAQIAGVDLQAMRCECLAGSDHMLSSLPYPVYA